MNILKHKSWHLYNQDNLERVRRDEKEAAAAEEKERARQQHVEGERRLETLRAGARAREHGVGADEAPVEHGDQPSITADTHVPSTTRGEDGTTSAATPIEDLRRRHVHLFAEEEAHAQHRANVERQREDRMRDDEEARRSAMYLDQGVRGHGAVVPWYLYSDRDRRRDDSVEDRDDTVGPSKSGYERERARHRADERERREKEREEAERGNGRRPRKHHKEKSKEELRAQDDRRKDSMDPMAMVQRASKIAEAKREAREKGSSRSGDTRRNPTTKPASIANTSDPWAKLRQERLQRELDERQKVRQLAVSTASSSASTSTSAGPSRRAFAVSTTPDDRARAASMRGTGGISDAAAPSADIHPAMAASLARGLTDHARGGVDSRARRPNYNSGFNPDIVDRLQERASRRR